jgi:hypothetical protein
MRTLRRLHRSTVVVALALLTLAGTAAPAAIPAAHARLPLYESLTVPGHINVGTV